MVDPSSVSVLGPSFSAGAGDLLESVDIQVPAGAPRHGSFKGKNKQKNDNYSPI